MADHLMRRHLMAAPLTVRCELLQPAQKICSVSFVGECFHEPLPSSNTRGTLELMPHETS